MAKKRKSFFYRGEGYKVKLNLSKAEQSTNHPFVRKPSDLQQNKETLSRTIALEYLKVSEDWN